MQGRLAAGAVERAAEDLAVDCHNTLKSLGEVRHELLKRSAKLGRIEKAEQTAEGIVAGRAMLELEKAAQERLFRRGEQCHVDRTLAAAQDRAKGDHQEVVEIVQTGIAGARILQFLPAGNKLIQGDLPGHVSHAEGRIDHLRAGQAPSRLSSGFKCDSPGRIAV